MADTNCYRKQLDHLNQVIQQALADSNRRIILGAGVVSRTWYNPMESRPCHYFRFFTCDSLVAFELNRMQYTPFTAEQFMEFEKKILAGITAFNF